MMNAPRNIIWLASYPKSGNTWVRAFLGNYFMPTGTDLSINELYEITTSDIRQDWYDKAAGRPFVGDTLDDSLLLRPKVLRLIAASKMGSQFVKTHSKVDKIGSIELILPEVTAAGICILRNPFDVTVSYARHSTITIDNMIDKMCDPSNCGASDTKIIEAVGRWDGHIKSWTQAPGLPRHIMRYEDMVRNPKVEFRKMLNFLKVPIQQKKLKKALEATSFKNLQAQETRQGFREKPKGAEKFFASGKYGTWKEVLTSDQVARIYGEFKETIDEFFPEVSKEANEFIKGAS